VVLNIVVAMKQFVDRFLLNIPPHSIFIVSLICIQKNHPPLLRLPFYYTSKHSSILPIFITSP
jgi:hypothetical protein